MNEYSGNIDMLKMKYIERYIRVGISIFITYPQSTVAKDFVSSFKDKNIK